MLEIIKQFFVRSSQIVGVFFDNRGFFTMALVFHPASFTIFDMVTGAKKCSFAKEHMDFVGPFFCNLMISLSGLLHSQHTFLPVSLAHLIDFPSFIIKFLTQKTVAQLTPRLLTMQLTLDLAQSIPDILFLFTLFDMMQ